MNVSDSKNQYLNEALDLMDDLGGSFVKSLAATCRVADAEYTWTPAMRTAYERGTRRLDGDSKDAARYRWLAQYPNLFTVNDLLRADQYTTLTRACDALMSVAAMAKESGND